MIIYLSGKMTGLPDLGRKKFAAAAKHLTQQGHIVLNPAALPAGMAKEKYMPICMAMLGQAEAIYMLDNWHDSPGAILEREYAIYQGIPVQYLYGPS